MCAKTSKDLTASRKRRQEVIDKYDGIPFSIWDAKFNKTDGIIELDKRKQNIGPAKVVIDKDTGEDLTQAFAASSISVRDGVSLSTFPPNIAKRIVNMYSQKGNIILDPYAGHNSRMQATYELSRNYIGYDICKEFMEFNREVAKTITEKDGKLFTNDCTITLKEQSSEKLEEADNSVDMIYTSPPYWNTEYYGPEKEQLGLCKTYEEFIDKLTVTISECYRVLKSDKYCIFNINDFRRKGVFHPYHADVIKAFQKVGFKMHDVIIIKWHYTIMACFASQLDDRQQTAKIHEFLVVGKKP